MVQMIHGFINSIAKDEDLSRLVRDKQEVGNQLTKLAKSTMTSSYIPLTLQL